jgi:adenine phosphoribosyltransferase
MEREALRNFVRDIPNFPQPGVIFKDITPALSDPEAFTFIVDELSKIAKEQSVTKVIALEARGFIFGSAVAYSLQASLIPVRKAGKLPHDVEALTYSLEYGESTLELHRDAVKTGDRCIIVDDVLATGGTAAAACDLVEKLGGIVAGVAVFIELAFLGGRNKLQTREVHSLLTYDKEG